MCICVCSLLTANYIVLCRAFVVYERDRFAILSPCSCACTIGPTKYFGVVRLKFCIFVQPIYRHCCWRRAACTPSPRILSCALWRTLHRHSCYRSFVCKTTSMPIGCAWPTRDSVLCNEKSENRSLALSTGRGNLHSQLHRRRVHCSRRVCLCLRR